MKKLWIENILTPTIWIESLYENSDDNDSKSYAYWTVHHLDI